MYITCFLTVTPGTDFLQQYLGYDNTGLDSALKEKGFHVLNHPSSNYKPHRFFDGGYAEF